MAGISQHIPNYVKGISRQPDELKLPGQVRDAKNCIPDVTKGLQKRPGARLVNTLGFDELGISTTTLKDGTWFSLYVDQDESYIGQINKDGRVEIWSTWDGLPMTVHYVSKPQNFAGYDEGKTAAPLCNTFEFRRTRNGIIELQNEIDELQLEIDVLQTKKDEYVEGENGSVIEAKWTRKKIKDDDFANPNKGEEYAYVIERGYVEEHRDDDQRWYIDADSDLEKGEQRLKKVYVITEERWKEAEENGDGKNSKIWNPQRYALGAVCKDPNEDMPNDGKPRPIRCEAPKCNIHDLKGEDRDPVGEKISQEDINKLKRKLKDKEEELEEELEKFADIAADCGTVTDPGRGIGRQRFAVRDVDRTANVLPYLKHENIDDIQTVSMNDRVMVVNRTVPVTMSDQTTGIRPCEGYVELKALAGGRTYSFGLDIAEIDSAWKEMRATKLDVSINGAENGESWEDDGNAGACSYSDVKLFENIDDNNGPGKNLSFELNTTGSSIAKNPEKPEKGYKCVYTTTVKLINGGQGWREGDQVEVEMKDEKYKITIKEVIEERKTAEFQVYSKSTSADGSVAISATEVLTDLADSLNNDELISVWGFEAEIVGNGLYITNNKGVPFTCVSNDWELLSCFGNQVTDVTQLPTQCKAGYICKVANTAAEEDDYYVQFFGTDGEPRPVGDITPQGALPDPEKENEARITYGSDGPGAWYECAKPGLPNILNSTSMPHQIRRVKSSDMNQPEFKVQPINWSDREVGDDLTNPIPRFVGLTQRVKEDGEWTDKFQTEKRYINNAVFYRNRLAFLTGEAIVMSQPIDMIKNEQFNFFKGTATTVTDSDPIDILVTSKNPTTLYDSLAVNNGLLLFSPTQQYLLSTDQDILSPKTANVNEISSYRFNEKTNPISMGTTVGFMSNAGKNGRFFEMTNISRDREAEVLEQSKIIADLIPENLNLLSHSKENTIIVAGDYLDRELWVYRYFNDGIERKQSAWVRWELTGDLVWQTIINDVLYIIVRNFFENGPDPSRIGLEVLTMQRIDLKESVWSSVVEDYTLAYGDNPDGKYTVHMDNFRVVWPTQMQYYAHLDQTYFRLPIGYFSNKKLAAYTLKYGKFQGRAIYPKIELDAWGTWCVLEGNWSATRLMIGYEFQYGVELPTIYPTKTENKVTKSDVSGNLTLHRMYLSLGANGVYETTLVRKGHQENYVQMYEARLEDGYLADDVAFDSEVVQTVPIYDRNINFAPNPWGIYITSSHPSPCCLVSMTWEGDFNTNKYQRV